jgi:hypothetical protein
MRPKRTVARFSNGTPIMLPPAALGGGAGAGTGAWAAPDEGKDAAAAARAAVWISWRRESERGESS